MKNIFTILVLTSSLLVLSSESKAISWNDARMKLSEAEQSIYLYGNIDMIFSFADENTRSVSLRDKKVICFPKNSTIHQYVGIAKQYIKSNPDEWHNPVHYLVMVSLINAFPCMSQ